jgi:hypothetical protein
MADRDGNPRPRLAEFTVEWHTTRFGLRNLADLNLLDLVASVRQHYKASVRVRWFGQFTGEGRDCEGRAVCRDWRGWRNRMSRKAGSVHLWSGRFAGGQLSIPPPCPAPFPAHAHGGSASSG